MGWEDVLLGSMLRVTALLPALMSASVQMGGQDNVLKIILKFTSSSSIPPCFGSTWGAPLSTEDDGNSSQCMGLFWSPLAVVVGS